MLPEALNNLLLIALAIGAIFVGAYSLLNGVFWLPVAQALIGLLVWRGGRNTVAAIAASVILPLACLVVFGLLFGYRHDVGGWSLVAGVAAVWAWALTPHFWTD